MEQGRGQSMGRAWLLILILVESNAPEELLPKEVHSLILITRGFLWDRIAMEKLR